MLLGDLITRLADETVAAEAILGLGDLGLLAEMQACAGESGVALGAYAAWAVCVYADNASSEEWTMLIGALSRSDDPSVACLRRAFAYVLAAESAPDEGAVMDN